MAGAIRPVVKGVYVCDDAIPNPVGGKLMLVNLWDVCRVPAGETVPHTLKKLCVFAWLRGGRGRVRFRVEVVRSDTGDRVGKARYYEHEFVEPNAGVHGRFLLTDVVFPVFGWYTVELFCDDEFLDDQTIRVVPFSE